MNFDKDVDQNIICENSGKSSLETTSPSINALAGAFSGLVSSLYTSPLDVVKTRLQNQNTSSNLHQKLVLPQYRGTLQTLKMILKEEGIRGWYRGLGPTLIGYLPTWSIYFTSYNEFKRLYSSSCYFSLPMVHVLSAVSAGMVSNTTTNPLWVVRTRLMLQSSYSLYHYKNTLHGMVTIFQTEGLKGLYKGLVPSLFGTAHVAVQFPLYEYLKAHFSSEESQVDTKAVLLASTVSKAIASVISYPHEVIRTRLQNQSIENVVKYRGVFDTIKKIYQEESVLAFYKGLPTNLIKVVPASALTFLTYESIASYCSRHFKINR